MEAYLFGIATAFWLGILTSISPCPLATNIAAISFIGKHVGNPRSVLFSGLFYTLGRVLTYVVIAILLITFLEIGVINLFLQKYMNKILGPLLILVGMFLLELLSINFSFSVQSEKLQKQAEKGKIWGAGLLGVVFALSFCPITGVIFFLSLIPLSKMQNSFFLYPAIYGVGTGLPVLVFAFIIAFATKHLGKAFNKVKAVELWARRITGGLFIFIGIYYSLNFIFGIFS